MPNVMLNLGVAQVSQRPDVKPPKQAFPSYQPPKSTIEAQQTQREYEQYQREYAQHQQRRQVAKEFYTSIGYPQFGEYEPFEIPEGYKIKAIEETPEGLKVSFQLKWESWPEAHREYAKKYVYGSHLQPGLERSPGYLTPREREIFEGGPEKVEQLYAESLEEMSGILVRKEVKTIIEEQAQEAHEEYEQKYKERVKQAGLDATAYSRQLAIWEGGKLVGGIAYKLHKQAEALSELAYQQALRAHELATMPSPGERLAMIEVPSLPILLGLEGKPVKPFAYPGGFVSGIEAGTVGLAAFGMSIAGVPHTYRPPTTLTGGLVTSGVESILSLKPTESKELRKTVKLGPEYALGTLTADVVLAWLWGQGISGIKKRIFKGPPKLGVVDIPDAFKEAPKKGYVPKELPKEVMRPDYLEGFQKWTDPYAKSLQITQKISPAPTQKLAIHELTAIQKEALAGFKKTESLSAWEKFWEEEFPYLRTERLQQWEAFEKVFGKYEVPTSIPGIKAEQTAWKMSIAAKTSAIDPLAPLLREIYRPPALPYLPSLAITTPISKGAYGVGAFMVAAPQLTPKDVMEVQKPKRMEVTKPQLIHGIAPVSMGNVKAIVSPIQSVNVKQMSKAMVSQASAQQVKQIQKQQQMQKQMQVQTPKFPSPFFEEPKRRRGKRKVAEPFDPFGRYKREYPLATPKQVMEMVVGKRGKK